jgi:hypothetical protein
LKALLPLPRPPATTGRTATSGLFARERGKSGRLRQGSARAARRSACRVSIWSSTGACRTGCTCYARLGVVARAVRQIADNESADATLRLLAECFEVLGGVPKVVLADRMGCLKGGSSLTSWCRPGLRPRLHALPVPSLRPRTLGLPQAGGADCDRCAPAGQQSRCHYQQENFRTSPWGGIAAGCRSLVTWRPTSGSVRDMVSVRVWPGSTVT